MCLVLVCVVSMWWILFGMEWVELLIVILCCVIFCVFGFWCRLVLDMFDKSFGFFSDMVLFLFVCFCFVLEGIYFGKCCVDG